MTQEVVADAAETIGDVFVAPTITAAVSLVAFVFVLLFRREILQRVCASVTGNVLLTLILAGSSLVSTALIDVIDLSDALDNKFTPGFHLQGSLLAVSLTAWLACLFFITYRTDSLKRSLGELARLESIASANNRLSRELTMIVGSKAARVRSALIGRTEQMRRPSAGQLETILDPKEQIALNFMALYRALRERIGTQPNLRLALYLPSEDGRVLRVDVSHNGDRPNSISTPNDEHAEWFGLGADYRPGCLATYTSIHGGLQIIPDTDELQANDGTRFSFFDPAQRTKIKSIVSYAYEIGDRGPYPVLVADTDLPGGFGEQNYPKAILSADFKEFGARLLFEVDMLNLLT